MFLNIMVVVASTIVLVLCSIILFLNDPSKFAINDDDNYVLSYQKWIANVCYFVVFSLYLFAVNFSLSNETFLGFLFMGFEIVMSIEYCLMRFKRIVVSDNNIIVERLFREPIYTKFSSISSVLYYPNAKIVVKIRKHVFDISVNSRYFHKFYKSLIKNDVKFKTMSIPYDQQYVCLTKFGITIRFPKTMFREFYIGKRTFKNGKYLFSARSLDNCQYIEGYFKDSEKSFDSFMEIVKNDLTNNEFYKFKEDRKTINEFDFHIIKSTSKDNKDYMRYAYVQKVDSGFFILYVDFNKDDEEKFIDTLESGIYKTKEKEDYISMVRI